MLILVMATVAFVHEARDRTPLPPPAPAAVVVSQAPVVPPVDPDAAMKVYRESITPLLDEFDQRNAQAADRALATLHGRIAMHRAGVEPFARDVRSWHTRFGVMRRLPSDLWHKVRHTGDVNQVGVYVNDKFRKQILSEDQLQQDIAVVLRQYEEDLSANRNRLYAQMSLPLSKIRCTVPLEGTNFDHFKEVTQRIAEQMNREQAGDTVVAGIAEFGASWIATDVAQSIASRVVAQILARVGTSLAVEGIEAGGATAGGAAAGGGAGSIAGPAGTVIGLGVGLVVGAAVDWWLSAEFEQRVTSQCHQFLSMLDHRLTEGNAATTGLRITLGQSVKLTGQSQRQAVYQAMKEIKPQ